jgi:uncharacterized protein (TIGR03437 family)
MPRWCMLPFLIPVLTWAQSPTVMAVVNAGSGGGLYTRLAPGVLAVVQGANLSTATAVHVGGRAAAVLPSHLGEGAVMVQIPLELSAGPTTLIVTTPRGVSQPFGIALDEFAPALTGLSRPSCLAAAAGEIVEAYAVGLGRTDPAVPTGVMPQIPSPTTATPAIRIGGRAADVIASMLVTWKLGVYQINFKVPQGLPEGIHPVALTIGGQVTDERLNTAVYLAVSEEAPGRWTFRSPVAAAPESIMIAEYVGPGFAAVNVAADPRNPPKELAGTSVQVKDSAGVEREATLLYVATGAVGYVIPPGTVPGLARVTIKAGNGATFTARVPVESVAPRIFTESSWSSEAEFPAALVVRIRDGHQTITPLALPIDLGPDTDEVFLSLFGTGLRFRSSLANVSAEIGGVATPILYAGPHAESAGLDQVNLQLPRTLTGRGTAEIRLRVDGKTAYAGTVQFK